MGARMLLVLGAIFCLFFFVGVEYLYSNPHPGLVSWLIPVMNWVFVVGLVGVLIFYLLRNRE